MKTIKSVLLVLMFLTCALSKAQVSVNVNIGSPPAWGPAGYTDVRYYYLPDIYTYYDVNTAQYIYINNGKWIRATTLPRAYRSYNLYNGYKVVVNDYRGTTPYIYYKTHKVKYPKGYKGKPQKTIGVPPGHAKKSVAVKSGNKVVVKSNGHDHKGHDNKKPGGNKGQGKGKH